MNPIDHAFRLMATQEAFVAVGLAAVAVVIAAGIAFRHVLDGRMRWIPALLIVSAGFLAGAVIIEATYYSWYRHRCVHHGSDIDECFGKDGKRLHDKGY
jgi:hypothetical protein